MAMSNHTETKTSYKIFAADGTDLHHTWSDPDMAAKSAEQYGNGAYVEPHTYEARVPAYKAVLMDSGIPEADWNMCCIAMNRMLNMAGDAGRPSDAMHSVVRAYKAGQDVLPPLSRQ